MGNITSSYESDGQQMFIMDNVSGNIYNINVEKIKECSKKGTLKKYVA